MCTDLKNLPKVEKTQDETGDNGKIGEVKTHRSARGNGKGDMVPRANNTVKGDCGGNYNVTDGAKCHISSYPSQLSIKLTWRRRPPSNSNQEK